MVVGIKAMLAVGRLSSAAAQRDWLASYWRILHYSRPEATRVEI